MSIKKVLSIKSAQEIAQEKRLALGLLMSAVGWISMVFCFLNSPLHAMGVEIEDQRPQITLTGAGVQSSTRFKKKWNRLLSDPSLTLLSGYSPAASSFVHAKMWLAEAPEYMALQDYVRRPQDKQSPTKRAVLEQKCVIAILDGLYDIEEPKISEQNSRLREAQKMVKQWTRANASWGVMLGAVLIIFNTVTCK